MISYPTLNFFMQSHQDIDIYRIMTSTKCNTSCSVQRLNTPAIILERLFLLCCCILSTFYVESFQFAPSRSSLNGRCFNINYNNIITRAQTTILRSTTAADTGDASKASKWMENEKRLEDEMDDPNNRAAKETSANKKEVDDESNLPIGRWEYIHGNYILRPPSSDDTRQQPRALIHFLGGALLGAAPQLSYRYLLERLARRGYLIVATPYQLSFDHLKSCDEIIDKFERGEFLLLFGFMLALEYSDGIRSHLSVHQQQWLRPSRSNTVQSP